MASVATEILHDVAERLRTSGLFAEVAVGSPAAASAVPRASVAYDGHDVFLSDDRANVLWVRLRARVVMHSRAARDDGRLALAADLASAVTNVLMADPWRGERCRDLPVGRATEVGRAEVASGGRGSEVEIALAVRCHYEIEEGT